MNNFFDCNTQISSSNILIEGDVYLLDTNKSNSQIGFKFNNIIGRLINANDTIVRIGITNTSYINSGDYAENYIPVDWNTWYTLRLEINQNIAVLTLLLNDNIISSVNLDISTYQTIDYNLQIFQGIIQNTQHYIKNIKIREL